MRPYTIDLLPDKVRRVADTNTARLTVIPVHLQNAMVTFLLGEGADSSIRALFSRGEGLFEMKFLSFTMKEYLARLEEWRSKDAEQHRLVLQKLEELNYSSEEEFSD